MDKLAKYRECVQSLLNLYANDDVADGEVEVQLIFDEKRDHYQWMNVGWEGLKRVYRCIIHFDIKNGKIWLQQNLTDQNPAEELVEMVVQREDIVLGLQPAYKRQYTDYGVA
ncbi:XisI protein [Nostoc sp. CCY0012]|uniref:XisI protein n=1 Tax=Nostoc sp. CCY0012 TaxID=1056123 RepID=UPI0039C76347